MRDHGLSRRFLALAGVAAALCVHTSAYSLPAFVQPGGLLLRRGAAAACSRRGLGAPGARGVGARGLGRAAGACGRGPRMAEGESGEVGVTMSEGEHEVDGFRCHHVVATPSEIDPSVPPLVLVHGFGISSSHFSKNMAPIAAATKTPVYAVDLLGFGKSAKPANIQYGQTVWAWQVQNLVTDVVKAPKVFIAGNSVGGFVSMYVAQQNQEMVAGLCLINPAGRFGVLNPLGVNVPIVSSVLKRYDVSRWLGGKLFDNIRQPEKVKSTLEQVYSDKSKVTQALVDAIVEPSTSDEALACGPDLFGSLLSAPQDKGWEELLRQEQMGYAGPLLCLWGEEDPWIVPLYAEVIKDIRPDLELNWLKAGHCPHDERPEEANALVAEWMLRLARDPPDFPVSFIPRYQKLPLKMQTLF